VIRPEIMVEILSGYSLPVMGIHGLPHWGRVLETGLRLATQTGADTTVVSLFAVFHDARRLNEGTDPDHGKRGAALASRLRSQLDLTGTQFAQLEHACIHHTDGITEGEPTVQTCWDADRLDLWRVGIRPHDPRLCTEAARDRATQDWSRVRSVEGYIPACSVEWRTMEGAG
jgi:uncharacterized protein